MFCFFQVTMLWYYAPTFLMLFHSIASFPRGKATEKPEVHPMLNPKHSRPTHISEFTDPKTGLNPFLDIEEGRTSMGRNVMEDEEKTNDEPFISNQGLDLVEGDGSDRRWILEEPMENFGRARWPELDTSDVVVSSTTPLIPPNPPTTVELFVTKDLEHEKSGDEEETQLKVKKEEKESFAISQSTVIYASASIAVVTAIIVLAGAFWWRKKQKTSQTTATTVENGEVKS